MALAEVRWPPFVTSSSWRTVMASLVQTVTRKRGKSSGAPIDGRWDGTAPAAPVITNGDAVTLVMAAMAAASPNISRLFPAWYQLAAVAYGWDPGKSDKLDTSATRRDAPYPAPMRSILWECIGQVFTALDNERVTSPRVDLDGQFSDQVFQGQVVVALRDDGYELKFSRPKLPAGCKDKNGKIGLPKCVRKMKTWPYFCTKYECDPHYVEIDPLKPVRDSATKLGSLVLLIVAAWVLFENKPRRTRRTG